MLDRRARYKHVALPPVNARMATAHANAVRAFFLKLEQRTEVGYLLRIRQDEKNGIALRISATSIAAIADRKSVV